ncbi:MAG: hypothetical protein ACRDTP_03090 [Mycobacteriales bacterium]
MSDSSAPTEHVDEHVVFFTTALGDPAAERYPTLQSAISRVESLCNEDHVEDAKVYALVPVPLQVTSFVRVEVDSSVYRNAPSIPAAPATPPPSAGENGTDAEPHEDAEPASQQATGGGQSTPAPVPSGTVTDVPDSVDGGSSHGRNLGFFVH